MVIDERKLNNWGFLARPPGEIGVGRTFRFIDGFQIGASALTGHISNLVRVILNSNITAIRFFK